jgi:hypothetical protein
VSGQPGNLIERQKTGASLSALGRQQWSASSRPAIGTGSGLANV